MKRVARHTEHKLVVVIPPIVRLSVVVVQLQLAIVVAVHVEHVRVTIGVRNMQNIIFTTTP
jgi:hypothetical protein